MDRHLAGGLKHALQFQECVLIPALRSIDAVFGSIKDALLRHEHVELPTGTFAVLRNPQEQARRFGTVIVLRKCRVDFMTIDELNRRAGLTTWKP